MGKKIMKSLIFCYQYNKPNNNAYIIHILIKKFNFNIDTTV